jgi:YD repeat-containing protein
LKSLCPDICKASDDYGHSVDTTPSQSANYARPGQVRPNNDANLAQNYTWNTAFLGLTQESGPNGTTGTVSYDAYARPQSTTSADGAVTNYTYTTTPPTVTATTNGHWVKTTYDGFGRAIKVERGDGGGTKSLMDSEYEPCACSPIGKLKRVSQPYAPGGTIYWTVYSYDALGRTVSVTHPDNSGTTSYAYVGNTVTVTDPAGKWKTYERDAFGNVTKTTEPNPAGGANLETTFAYNLVDQMTQVVMIRGTVTQTRTLVYNMATLRLSSETHPESGTTSYQYHADGSLSQKTLANGKSVQYSYDALGRTLGVWNWASNGCGNTFFEYDSAAHNTVGRVWKVRYGGETCAVTTGPEWGLSFGYDGFGNKVSQTVVKGSAPAMTIAVDGNNRVIGHSYDAAGFPVAVAGSFTSLNWDSLGRLLSVAVTGGGTDTYAYDAQNRRVWRNNRLFVRGAGGEVLALYDFNAVTKLLYYVRRYDWFAGKLAGKREDRLETVETGSRFYPYGEESPSTGQDAEVCDVLAGFEYGVGLCDGAVLFQWGGAVFDAGSVPGERVGGAERELEPVCVCGGGSG